MAWSVAIKGCPRRVSILFLRVAERSLYAHLNICQTPAMKALASSNLWRLLALGGAALYAASRSKGPSKSAREISVTGNGEVECEPDIARVRVAVRSRQASAKEAAKQLELKIAAVIEALTQEAKLSKDDLQTTQLSIHQDRHKPEGKKEYVVEYVARTEIMVNVREISLLGQVLDVAHEAGIDELEGLEFDLQDQRAPKRKALALAVKDAKARAETLASNAGMSVGAVLRMTDGPDYDVDRSGTMLASSLGYAGAIATGSIAVSAQAFVKFELVPLENGYERYGS